MRTLQVLVLVTCLSIVVRQIDAVVNSGANTKDPISVSTETNSEINKESTPEVTDSTPAESEQEADKREAVIDLTGIYGTPINTYSPPGGIDTILPIPVYGVPNLGQNIIYPAPPPDIPPPSPVQYGVPNPPPKFSYGPPKYKLPRIKYGPPFRQRLPKPIYGPPRKPYFPKPIYGPPKPRYGLPKQQFPKIISKPIYIPTIQQEAPILNPPPVTYGPPSIQPIKQYGPPPSVVHGPPPGVPAPPTPPDIKYDGWQPIPGLVSKSPHDTYGPPQGSYNPPPPLTDHSINTDFTPPQEGTVGIDSLGLQEHYKSGGVVSDSYGAPLNSVTGSGGIVQISGEAHHQQSHQNQQEEHQKHQQGLQNYHQDLSVISLGADNALSVVKSVGYELQGFDGYTAPPAGSYSPEGSYPSINGHKYTQTHAYNSVNGAFGSQHFSKDIGLIPPSGVYGVTPNNQYGTLLFQPANNYNDGLKRPVVFRDSVSSGRVQPSAFIPPSLPDIKPVKEEIHEPSDLYSLPHIERPISFQNLVHGSSTAGLSTDISLNSIESHQGSDAAPLHSNGNVFGTVGYSSSGYHHDCNSHGSQLLPPQFTYGVPSADLSGSHSIKVATSSNSISEAAQEVYAKSFGESLASGGELVKSESLDLNNIPLHGALGSYTLQIQSADALGGSGPSSSGVPHEQVLNDGLLQSILAAIEQPHQHQQQGSIPIEVNSRSDTESQASFKSAVTVLSEENTDGSKRSAQKVDDNEVAIYLKSNESDAKKSDTESYVSVKTTDTNYKYDLKTSLKDETSTGSSI